MRVVPLALALGACAGEGPLGVNEVASRVAAGVTNERGAPTDWIEVLNDDRGPRSLAGWTLRVGAETYGFPDVELDAGELLLVLCDGDTDAGELHAGFALPDGPFDLDVADADGGSVQRIMVPATPVDHSFGRVPDDAPNWQLIDAPTPARRNVPR